MTVFTVVGMAAIGLVAIVLLHRRRRPSLERVLRATARRGQQANHARIQNHDGLVAGARERALAEQIAALDLLVVDQQRSRISADQYRKLMLLRGEALVCSSALREAQAVPTSVSDALLEKSANVTERLRIALLSARSGQILCDWKARQLAEVDRVEALAARREASAEAELRIEADAERLKARIR